MKAAGILLHEQPLAHGSAGLFGGDGDRPLLIAQQGVPGGDGRAGDEDDLVARVAQAGQLAGESAQPGDVQPAALFRERAGAEFDHYGLFCHYIDLREVITQRIKYYNIPAKNRKALMYMI